MYIVHHTSTASQPKVYHCQIALYSLFYHSVVHVFLNAVERLQMVCDAILFGS